MPEANAVAPVKIPDSFRRYFKQHLIEDHEKLEAILDDAACLAEHRSYYTAAKRFEEFRMRQEQHMAVEEDIVFPLLETAFPGSPVIPEVKAEHQAIRHAMEAANNAITESNREQFGKVHGDLVAALMAHTKHEDELLDLALASCVSPNREVLTKIARL
jgi:iron-sulfur cluster repair protein YtfE (RIC family)